MTRTHNKHIRAYINGVDVSGYTRAVGSLDWTFGAEPDSAVTDECKNILIGHADIQAGGYSAFLDNDAAGLFALTSSGNGTKTYTVAIGANRVPAAGDPVFSWMFEQTSYAAEAGAGFVAVTVPFGGASYASTLTYKKPWGVLIHPRGTETAANIAVGIDDNGASSALGGIFVYHLHSSDGTVTLSVDDAATNVDGSFTALSGATSGSITAAVSPKYGMVALGVSATVRRYLRFQLAMDTATTCSFTSAFIRNNIGV